jgi:Holliday junction resolvase RusA-like endonuclease
VNASAELFDTPMPPWSFATKPVELGPVVNRTEPVYRIIVYGSPAPQGSKKFVGTYTGKDGRVHGMMGESSSKVKPWREDVKAAALLVRNGKPALEGPIIARMVFTVPKPASSPKRRRIYAMRKPDLSKLVRSTEDALSDAFIWTDDARVIEYSRLAKVYPGEDPEALEAPGVIVSIWSVPA